MKVYFGINDYIENVSMIKVTRDSVEFVTFPYKKGKYIGRGAVYSRDYIDRIDMMIVTEDTFSQLTGVIRNECDVIRTISYENFPVFINEKLDEYKDDAVIFRINRIRLRVLSDTAIDNNGKDCYRFSVDCDVHIAAEVPSIQYDSRIFPIYDMNANVVDKTIRRFRVSNGDGSYRDFDSSSGYNVIGRSTLNATYTTTSPKEIYENFPKVDSEISGFKLKEYITEFAPEVIIAD